MGGYRLYVNDSCKSLELQKQLSNALKRKELQLYYQPKLDMNSGEIKGVEALIRWKHTTKGMISPLEFIPLIEGTEMMFQIGEWVIRNACEQNKAWQEACLPPMIMAVNLSAQQFYQLNLVNMVENILKETELSPAFLELEITESMMMDIHSALPILRNLKQLGVRISLDDFGTGYSSLSYLKELPIDIIKIDQSFIRNCTTDSKDATIVKAIIAMSHELNVEVIAEGIETKDQLIFLQQNLCNKGQGYFFCKPIPSQELIQKFDQIEQIVDREGIPSKFNRQKWLEKELKSARQELQETMRLQQGMIFKYTECDGKFIHTLCDGELLYRIGLTPEHLIGRELHDVLTNVEAERKLQYYRRAWEGGENVVYEGKLNGIWYLASLRPIRRGGQVVEVIGSCVDISERKKVEQALEESEQRYRRLVELSPEPIVVHQKGYIQFANPAFVKLLRASSIDELIGKPVLDYSPPEYMGLVKQRILELNREGISVKPTEETIIGLDGTLINVEVTGISFIYDGTPSYLMMLHDLTKRKEQEDALRKSEEKYRLITENIQDLIGVLDITGVVHYASQSHETVLGFPPYVYEGKSAFDMVHPDDILHIQQQFAKMVLSKKPCFVEFRYKHNNGGWVYVEASGTPVLDEKMKVKHLVVMARDISERKKVEELIRKSEKLSVVGKLAAGVAHEIRNPLTSIKGFIQLLQKGEENPSYYDIIHSEICRLDDIVGGFLTFARLQGPQMNEVDIKVLLEEIIQLFEKQNTFKNVNIVQTYCAESIWVQCDKNQMKQIFINIVKNAVEAMPNGGVLKIHLLKGESESIQIRFVDEGCGISEERMEHIGEPFFSTKEKGTGLGLMISKKIVEEHGGTISIESKINQGTTVEINLPIHLSKTQI